MDTNTVLNHFRDSEALLEGHFLLSSGLHSRAYLQCARVLMNPERAALLCGEVARRVKEELGPVDLVVSPAMGGVIVGYEMARQLGVDGIFAERVDGTLTLRRGFDIPKGAKVLMVEDIVTTGLSSRECIDCIREWGGEVVGATCLIDRSNGKADVGVPLIALAKFEVETFDADNVPDDLKDIPAIKPGSRGLK